MTLTRVTSPQRHHNGAIALLAAALGAALVAESRSMAQVTPPPVIEGKLPSLGGSTGWLNSQPLSATGLRGKVVLVQFWTYSCVNWRRTLPYIRAWSEKYRDHGLVVIGVHTPEFSFERDRANVLRATQELGITYPVALDSDHAIWRSFSNQYWPALYLADAQGHIRYHHFGEGDYQQTELAIQQLLREGGDGESPHNLVTIEARGAEAAADWRTLHSPETYVGYAQIQNFASPGGVSPDSARAYQIAPRLRLNEWALAGNWTIGKEAAVLNTADGRVVFHFHARDLNLIMSPPPSGTAVRFRVLLDGRPPGTAHGVDTDRDGGGTVTQPRMYQLIRAEPVTDHEFQVEFMDPAVSVFDFTFG